VTLLFFDGFDQYDSATDAENYGGWHTASTMGVTADGSGRNSNGRAASDTTGLGVLLYEFAADQATKTVTLGFALKFTDIKGQGPIATVSRLASTNIGFANTLLWFNGLTLEIRTDYLSGTPLITGTEALVEGVWYYIEWENLVHNSTGTSEVRINETVDMTITSADTQNETTDLVLAITLGSSGVSGPEKDYDDFYVLNDDGSAKNSYLGDVSSKFIAPTSDSSVQLSPTGEASNYLTVDDDLGAPDDDTTYSSSGTVTDKDSYGLASMPTSSSVVGVKVNARLSKDDSGTRDVDFGITTGANAQAVTAGITTSYVNYITVYEDIDGAGGVWTETNVNAAVATIEITS